MNTENDYSMDEVVSVKEWLGMMLIMCVPILNIVFLIKWLVGSDSVNRNKTNLIRAQFIFSAIIIAIMVIFMVIVFSLVVKFIPDNLDSTGTKDVIESRVDTDDTTDDNNSLKIKINDNTFDIKIPDNYTISDNNEDIISAETSKGIVDYMTISDSGVEISDSQARDDLFAAMVSSDDNIVSQNVSNDYIYVVIKNNEKDYQCKFTKLIDIGADNYLQISINAYADGKSSFKTADTYLDECKCFEK